MITYKLVALVDNEEVFMEHYETTAEIQLKGLNEADMAVQEELNFRKLVGEEIKYV